MNYETTANIVALSHGLLILIVLGGIFLSIRIKRYRPIEALLLILAVIIWSLYGGCPLTTLENYLRTIAGSPAPMLVTDGFIPYYLIRFFDWRISGDTITILTYALVFVFLVLSIEWEIPILKRIQDKLAHKRYRSKM